MRELEELALTELGFFVLQAENAERAEVILNQRFDISLVITDLNMPGKSGLDLVKSIRQMAHHRATPVLLLTTESRAELKQRARDAGATGWMVKPFERNTLQATIRRVMR
jgi:two-component system chemotaxis response regulator CheY